MHAYFKALYWWGVGYSLIIRMAWFSVQGYSLLDHGDMGRQIICVSVGMKIEAWQGQTDNAAIKHTVNTGD